MFLLGFELWCAIMAAMQPLYFYFLPFFSPAPPGTEKYGSIIPFRFAAWYNGEKLTAKERPMKLISWNVNGLRDALDPRLKK